MIKRIAKIRPAIAALGSPAAGQGAELQSLERRRCSGGRANRNARRADNRAPLL